MAPPSEIAADEAGAAEIIPADAAPAAPQPADPHAARIARHQREKLVIAYLNRGISVPEIAVSLGITEKRTRALIREILARRMPAPPQDFVAMQVGRLNEALLVAYSAMSGMNLKAVDRVVKIVRELDRYHGFAAPKRDEPAAVPNAALEGTATFGHALICGINLEDQGIQKIELLTEALTDATTAGPLLGVACQGASADARPSAPGHGGQLGNARGSRNPLQDAEMIDFAPEFAPIAPPSLEAAFD